MKIIRLLQIPPKDPLWSFGGICLAFLFALVGLAGYSRETPVVSRLHYGTFDTVIQIYASVSEKKMDELADLAFSEFDKLSRLFDIYYGYSGMINLYDINQRAAQEPVAVDDLTLSLLELGKEVYTLTEGRVNIAMGAVLSLWHEARESGILPNAQALSEAMRHCNIDDLILDGRAGTVYFADPAMSLDVGSIAKGFACQLVAHRLETMGYNDFLINAGGNIVARGRADASGRLWNVGIQDPKADGISSLTAIQVTDCAVVTSGDYQRYMEVEGERYHHIIDPGTGYPGVYARSVTVVGSNSGLADVLSTAFFLMPAADAIVLADSMGVGVLIITTEGGIVENSLWVGKSES